MARYGATTLWRKRRAGLMPEPIDRGAEDIYDRDAVLKALGLLPETVAADNDNADPWTVNPDAIRQARSGKVRHAPKAA